MYLARLSAAGHFEIANFSLATKQILIQSRMVTGNRVLDWTVFLVVGCWLVVWLVVWFVGWLLYW